MLPFIWVKEITHFLMDIDLKGMTMDEKLNLSKNDAIVMEILWKKGEITTASVLQELKCFKGFTRDTVKTYIRRLREKNLVGVREISPKKHFYYPLISKNEYLANETRQFLDNHYSDITHMVAGLIESEQISDDEIADLENYIKQLKDKHIK